jgi:hypothetical protein
LTTLLVCGIGVVLPGVVGEVLTFCNTMPFPDEEGISIEAYILSSESPLSSLVEITTSS